MKMHNINKHRLLLIILVISTMFLGCIKSYAQKSPEWIVYNCLNMPQAICNKKISDFTIDKYNKKWLVFQSDSNLVGYDDLSFNFYGMPSTLSYCLVSPRNLIADTNGGIWFIYTGQCDYILKFYNNAFSEYFSQYFTITIDVDSINRVWIYSNSGEPYNTPRLQINSAEDFSSLGGYSYPLNSPKFKCLKNGDTWISSMDFNNLVQIRNDSCIYHDTTETQLPHSGFSDMCIDNDNNVWFASLPGMVKYDNIQFRIYDTTNYNFKQSIHSITCDPNNRIWLGTDSGLIKFDTVNCQIFNTNNSPLPYNKVTKVMADKFGNIWMLCGNYPHEKNYFCVYREGGVILNTSQTEVTEQKIYIYPNPVISELRVNASIINGRENKIELYDVRGRIVQSQTTKEPEIVLDISHLPAGVYSCAVSNEKYRETVKVVKL